MTTLQGALLKAVNIAWDDFSADIKKSRKAFQKLDAIMVIPNVPESFEFKVEEEAAVWRVRIGPTKQMGEAWHRAFEREHPHTKTNALNYYYLQTVVRKSDFKILERIVSM